MKDDNCIFCKLANKDIPTNIIYEDEKFTVILDASPATKGHALILPKNHAANIYELPDEDAADIFVLAKKLISGRCHGWLGLPRNRRCHLSSSPGGRCIRIRSRLTLGRRSLPRNPYAFPWPGAHSLEV